MFADGWWIDVVQYELIPQTGMELDGFIWSSRGRLPVAPTELTLHLADMDERVPVSVILLGFDRLLWRYRYGIRLPEPSQLALETMPLVMAGA